MNAKMRFQRKAALTPQTSSFMQPQTFDTGVIDQLGPSHDFSRIQIHAPAPETVQTKLTIGQPEDSYEQEAERVAGQVIQTEAPASSEASPRSQDTGLGANDLLTRQEASGTSVYEAAGALHLLDRVLGSGGGQPLDGSTGSFMEPRFGHDFSRVRIRTDERTMKASLDFSCLPLIATEQPHLAVSHSSDASELKAELPAEQILHHPATEAGTGPGTHKEAPDSQTEILQEKTAVAMPDLANAPEAIREVLQSSGQPLDEQTRAFMGPRFGHNFSHVRVHREPQAALTARAVQAHAYTVGTHIVFGEGQYVPGTHTGQHLLAHELAHVVQNQESTIPILQRETAQELVDKYTDKGYIWNTLRVGDLANDLVTKTRAKQYAFVRQVILEGVSYSKRDDVSLAILNSLTIPELIQMAHDPAAVPLFQVLADELSGGWETEEEANKVQLLRAVLSGGPDRLLWNRQRILALKALAPTDLEALALLFEDDSIVDEGTVSSRLQSILQVTEHPVIPGLQTGIDFGDTGFAGDQQPGGSGFRDPHPESRNQVGHFLTAVGLEFSPDVVSRPIPIFVSIRSMVGAPAQMSNQEVALRLTIGHEKRPDPPGGVAIFIDIITTGLIERYLAEGPEGETEEERDRRVGEAIEREIGQKIQEVIAAFRAQFQATTDDDIAAWSAAQAQLGTGNTLDRSALEGSTSPLNRIAVDPSQRGNSQQDLRLSLVGWKLGQLIQSGAFPDRTSLARWIRTNLGPAPAPPTP